ncbi:GNAT family N-acetyltransferase [Ilumatobacter sp.]|uniref:GNAT family N-acetyltransferase n=1 Tax=Ilumatobacter sp. TaxID=1967498 RepID=UPI003B51C7B5
MSNIDGNGADEVGASPSPPDGIEVRTLHTADEMAELDEVFQQVWGSLTQLVTIEILMAVTHSGGYVSAAYETRAGEERMLGASVAILARHQGRPALHSHITGLLPGARRSGLGRAMKLHQRAWAHEQELDWIVWTFDPLVRRNAWFNIAVLGAEVHEYLPSFYGTMSDSINAGDDSDRLLVAWEVDDPEADESATHDGSDAAGDGRERTLIATPDDVVALRRTDPVAVARWRRETRTALVGALERGDRVVGFTQRGEYVLEASR